MTPAQAYRKWWHLIGLILLITGAGLAEGWPGVLMVSGAWLIAGTLFDKLLETIRKQ